MRAVVTGADGFIGKNLQVHLRESKVDVLAITSRSTITDIAKEIEAADFVFHLAGVNRPNDPAEFEVGNVQLTREICELVRASGRPIPILYTSSTQAEIDNAYGASKRSAEAILLNLSRDIGAPVYIYRLPNVFGKWSRPNYNSVVATFCYNVANGLPVKVHDPDAMVHLVYIDDAIADFLRVMSEGPPSGTGLSISPIYQVTVGELAARIKSFAETRKNLIVESVGTGLNRALYATYLTFLGSDAFAYTVTNHQDPRGRFVEMLKTRDSGQISFLTAHPGITRGGHYHHTKTEKFLVVQGKARFGFRHLITDERREVIVEDAECRIVETIPGWAHDITNVGEGDLIAMLWANEIFDRDNPDTVAHKV